MTYGEYRRAKPRVNVLRGYGGNEPTSLTLSAPVNASHVDIRSGMLISLASGQWVKGCAQGSVPYIAYHDAYDASTGLGDTDVQSSGLLLGLSCAGDFEIETAYYNTTGVALATDQYLIADTAGQVGYIKNGAAVALSAYALDIVGFVTKGERTVQGGSVATNNSSGTEKFRSNQLVGSGANVAGAIWDPLQNVNSQATIGTTKTLTFVTRWTPHRS